MSKLAKFAVITTEGRQHNEEAPKYRTEFQRDRDRIIHCSAFRRLEYKTQVFVNHEGDLFRTRLTHSLEVAQVARSIAYALDSNVDLVEAICLAHDLGHTPFGHVGQDELNSCLHEVCGEGFEHNLQSLRIVDKLEERYVEFNGLNLTFETRQGILKHCSLKTAAQLGDVGLRFIQGKSPTLEAQLANVADELAYNFHDVDDGLRANLLTLDQLMQVSIIREQLQYLRHKYPTLHGRRLHKELVRRMTNASIYDLIENTRLNLAKFEINSRKDIYEAPQIVQYSEGMYNYQRELKKFLNKNLYSHSSIVQLRFKVSKIIRSLFEAYISDVRLLPEKYQEKIADDGIYRVVADYISGMTDRYAFRQYNKLFTVENV